MATLLFCVCEDVTSLWHQLAVVTCAAHDPMSLLVEIALRVDVLGGLATVLQ